MAYRLPPPPPPGRAPDCPMDPEGTSMEEMLSKVFQFEIMIHILKDCKRQLHGVRESLQGCSMHLAHFLEQSMSLIDQSIEQVHWLKVLFLHIARNMMEQYYNTHGGLPDVEGDETDETT
eukprot:s4337_g1.t1